MRKRRRGYTTREQRRRAAAMRRRALILGAVLLLAALALTPQTREAIAAASMRRLSSWPVFSGRTIKEETISLPQRKICALQLGVFDNGEHAQSEMKRLMAEGIPCVIWQKEQMRIICSAAENRNELDMFAAERTDACVIEETLPAVALKLTCGEREMDDVREMLLMPDSLFGRLQNMEEGSLSFLVGKTRIAALQAEKAHPENELYTQLAQSLVNWCSLMDTAMENYGEQRALPFAQATICTLCRELRAMLTAQQRDARIASAQRIPSTAADVMPPA